MGSIIIGDPLHRNCSGRELLFSGVKLGEGGELADLAHQLRGERPSSLPPRSSRVVSRGWLRTISRAVSLTVRAPNLLTQLVLGRRYGSRRLSGLPRNLHEILLRGTMRLEVGGCVVAIARTRRWARFLFRAADGSSITPPVPQSRDTIHQYLTAIVVETCPPSAPIKTTPAATYSSTIAGFDTRSIDSAPEKKDKSSSEKIPWRPRSPLSLHDCGRVRASLCGSSGTSERSARLRSGDSCSSTRAPGCLGRSPDSFQD